MDDRPQLLVVDDDAEIRNLLMRFLGQHGFRIRTAANGTEMRAALEDRNIALVILDLLMPGEHGLSLCRDLRARSGVPVIMLTAIGEDTDRIVGLEVGADDYVTKPFNPRELLARIKAVLRRTGVVFDGWRLDLVRRELFTPGGVLVDLSAGEYDLLVAFCERPQQVVSREYLMDFAKGRSAGPIDRSIDVQVSRLRRKLDGDEGEGPQTSGLIKTVRGAGYMLTREVERQ
jgi:two-component system OmpR family response regulator